MSVAIKKDDNYYVPVDTRLMTNAEYNKFVMPNIYEQAEKDFENGNYKTKEEAYKEIDSYIANLKNG